MNLPFELTGSLELVWRATWQAALLATVVWIAVTVFRRWLTPRWRTLLWTIPLLRCCLLILPATSMSLYGLVEHPVASELPEARTNAPAATVQLPTESVVPSPASLGEIPVFETAAEEIIANAPQPSAATVPEKVWNISMTDAIGLVWAAGVAAFCRYWCVAQLFLRRTLSRCQPLSEQELNVWLGETSGVTRRRRRIRYLVSEENLGPASCGLWRPAVVLPRQLLSELSTEEIRTVIRHEVAHIRRWDGVLLVLSQVATAIHWFNPLVYYLRHRLRREIELAVDAVAIRGLAEESRKAYGQLLLKLSQRPASRFGLVEMASSRSAVGRRIDQLLAPPRESRLATVFALVLVVLLAVSGLTEAALTQADVPAVSEQEKQAETVEPANTDTRPSRKYYVAGTVRDAENQEPVAGAEIKILIETETDLNKTSLTGVTDENGKYRIEVPLGHVQLWMPALKPGYWLQPEDHIASLTTSPGQPVVTHDLVAQRGPVWRVRIKGDLQDPNYRRISMYEVQDDDKRRAWMKGEGVRFEKPLASSLSTVDEQGNGRVTEPGNSRKLMVNASTEQAELIAEPEFDNTQVVSAQRQENSDATKLTDSKGHSATITGATVILEDGKPLLTFEARIPAPDDVLPITGTVVDTDGRPLEGVKLGVALGFKGGGSGMRRVSAQTDGEGRFKLEVPVTSGIRQKSDEYRVSLVLTKQGYAGKDTEYYPLSPKLEPIDAGTITMQPGYSIPVRVLDDRGEPASGAVIRPGDNYALRMQSVRTDEEGRAVVRDLPAGRVSFHATHGDLHQTSYLIVSTNEKENEEITIRVQELSALLDAPKKLKTLPVGTQAPELFVTEWSDGKQRALADYRGKVVVLEFWGVWCGGCITMIPTQQKLAERYGKQGVEFLGIHSAGGDMEQIRKLQELKKWTTPTAIDRGTMIQESETCQVYGIRGFPAVMILDREGKIAFSSDIEPEDPQAYQAEIAKLAGVPWPPADDLSEEEQIALANKIFTALFSREIEKALAAGR